MTAMTAAELKALHDAATPGVWGSKGFAITVIGSGGSIGYPPTDGCIASLDDGEYIANKNADNDAALIVAVKNNLPAIIEAMEFFESVKVDEKVWLLIAKQLQELIEARETNEKLAAQLAEVTAERDAVPFNSLDVIAVRGGATVSSQGMTLIQTTHLTQLRLDLEKSK
jgi:hypothetical protein